MEEIKLKESKTSLVDLIAESLMDLNLKEDARTDAEEEGYKDGMRDEKEDLKDKPKAKKVKKETIDTKLAEIEKQGKVITMEAQMDALDELISSKTQRVEMISEDEDLSELADKSKIKAMQKEIKDLGKRRAKMEKLYEKMCGKAYVKTEIVDESDSIEY